MLPMEKKKKKFTPELRMGATQKAVKKKKRESALYSTLANSKLTNYLILNSINNVAQAFFNAVAGTLKGK